jgi:predicted dehydrogenase
MTADLDFTDGRTAHLVCDMLSPRLFRSMLRVEGEAGRLSVMNPYHPHWFHWLSLHGRNGSHPEHVRGANSYTLQLRAFIKAIRGETKLNTDPADAIGNMRLIDAIYEKAGLQPRGT